MKQPIKKAGTIALSAISLGATTTPSRWCSYIE